MSRIPPDLDTCKAMRIIGRTESWPYVRDWLERNLAAARREAYRETEPYMLNRVVGEAQTFSSVLEEFGNAPMNEARLAKADSPSDIGSDYGREHETGGTDFLG